MLCGADSILCIQGWWKRSSNAEESLSPSDLRSPQHARLHLELDDHVPGNEH